MTFAGELLLPSRSGSLGLEFVHPALDDLGQPHATIGMPLTVLVLIGSTAVARAAMRGMALRG